LNDDDADVLTEAGGFSFAKIGEIASKYALDALICLPKKPVSKAIECVANAVCRNEGDDSDDCQYARGASAAFELAEGFVGKGDDKEKNNSPQTDPIETARIAARKEASEIKGVYEHLDCSALDDEKKKDLTARLNKCQALFITAGMQQDFNDMIKNLELTKCDVKKEFGCTEKLPDTNIKITKFSPVPQCSPSYFKQWGVPVMVGGGVGVGLNMVANLPMTWSVIGGGLAFGITKYFMHKSA
jgi:hypothetical protein